MGVRIGISAISQAPTTKMTRTFTAFDRKTSLKVEECLATAWAAESENFVDNAMSQDVWWCLGFKVLTAR
jgi:hypothetical protein